LFFPGESGVAASRPPLVSFALQFFLSQSRFGGIVFFFDQKDVVMTLGPGEEREVERIPAQLRRFL
jgi:hypothetical protein